MSDHVESTSSDGYSFAPLLGTLTLIGVPVAMIVMLGISGYAFLKNAGIEQVEAEQAPVELAPTPAPAPAPAPAPDGSGGSAAPAPAPAPAATASNIDPAVMTAGQTAYANCLACHGADGQGIAAGALKMAPPLAGSELLLGEPERPLLIVLKGIQKETNDFLGVMAPLAAALDDEKLAAVLTYARNSFGNSAPPVTAEQAASARAKFGEVPAMLSRTKIDEIVEAHK